MKNTTLTLLTITLLFSCKKEEINPDDYPATIERRVEYVVGNPNFWCSISEDICNYEDYRVMNLSFSEFEDGSILLEDYRNQYPDSNYTMYLVSESIYEEGFDTLLNFNNLILDSDGYKINNLNDGSAFTFDDLLNCNCHISVDGFIGPVGGNVGLNSNKGFLDYSFLAQPEDIDSMKISFKGVENGSAFYFRLFYQDSGIHKYYYAHAIKIELVSGSIEDNNNDILIEEMDHLDYIIKNSPRYDSYVIFLTEYSLERLKNIDAHIRFVDAQTREVFSQVNIGINAE